MASIADAVEAMRAARKKITFLFIDHEKEKYVEDLVYFEESGLMCSPGCTVVADNILCFDSPLESYLAHVSDTGKYSDFQLHESVVEYSGTASGSDTAGFGLNGAKDGIAVSVLK